MDLTKQCQTVYDYLMAHPGCTMLDIINVTGLPYAPDRVRELRRGGVPIIVVGQKKEAEGREVKLLAIRQASLDTLPIPGLLSEGPLARKRQQVCSQGLESRAIRRSQAVYSSPE